MQYYGQFTVPVDEFIYERYFKSERFKNNGFFIECGAFDGLTECSCKFFEETLGWKGINVEASPAIFPKLVENRPKTINCNMALSDENAVGTFYHAIHPILGEQFGNGSLHHTDKHRKELEDKNCRFQEYQVNIIRYSDLLEQYHVNHVDLFVLDVEGNELKVIDSMRGGHVLPDVFCVEHGNLDKKEVIATVESLGYKYDTSSYVNSFFVKNDYRHWWGNWKAKRNRNEKFFSLAKITEDYVLAGRAEDESKVRDFRESDSTFGSVSVDMNGGQVCIFAVCGVNGKPCGDQVVHYYLRGDKGDRALLRAIPQERLDYAEFRKSDLYRMAGSRVLVDRAFFKSKHYDVWMLLEQGSEKYLLKNHSIDL